MATQVSDTGVKTRTRGPADELAVIAQRAQAFTSASGTAIALSEGNSEEIICRARSGASAPEVGTALRVEGSFTGLCIQSGKELRCDDAETDTRVDTAAIRALGIRSMVVTPIKEENRVVGVLAVFAPTAHAFTITHVAVLKTMADQIGQLLQKARHSRDEAPEPDSSSLMPVALARPTAPSATPTIPAPIVIKHAPSAPPATPRAVPPAVSKLEPIRAAAVIEPLAAPTVSPKKDERRAESKTQPAHVSFGTFDSVAATQKKSGSRWVLIVAAVLVIGAGATFAYVKMRKASAPAQRAAIPVAPAPSVQPPAPAGAIASNPVSEPASPPAASIAPPPAAKPKDENTESSKRTERNSKPSPAAAESARPEETVALTSRPSRIATQAPVEQAQPVPDTTPALTTVGGSSSGSLNSLASARETSTPSMLAQSTLEQLKVIKRVAPVYPPVARQRLLSATVVVEATVNAEGKVSEVRMISGSPIFRESAIDAVKQWIYQPAKLNGQPIEQKTTIQLSFKP